MQNTTSGSGAATAGGVFAVLIWSTTVAVSRSVSETLGPVTAAALLLGGGGVLGLVLQGIRYRGFSFLRRFPRRYLVVCGLLFVGYETALYLAIGLAQGREQVLAIGLINYLWIPLTQVLSVPLFKKRASWWLAPGILLASGGAILAVTAGSGPGASAAGGGGVFLYAAALFCGVSWALYSNLSKLLGGSGTASAVPMFLAASGALLALFVPYLGEQTIWTVRGGLELVYMAVFPSVIGYMLWDSAMRRGNMVLVTALAYFIPVASTVISGRYLGVSMGAGMWVACGMVTAGAFITRVSIRDTA